MGDVWVLLIHIQNGIVSIITVVVEGIRSRIWVLPALAIFMFALWVSWRTRQKRLHQDRASMPMPQARRR